MLRAALDASFETLTPQGVAEVLETDLERGLAQTEASERLAAVGRNTLRSSARTAWLALVVRQVASPLILILIAAGVVTVIIGEYEDAVFILVAVVVNAALGFYQENKAERALAELKTYLRDRARVIRDGREREIDAEELVPGDVITLAQGDRVPADARITYVNDLQVDESVMTGESLPVVKAAEPLPAPLPVAEQASMTFAGTLVTEGVGTAVVCRTAGATEFGKIASLITGAEHEQTPLQEAINEFSVYASVALGLLTTLVFVIGVIAGYSVVEMFLTSVAIAVLTIPEGLPVAMTVILAVGVERMARRKAVVRKLAAAEALGGATVILTDKTGTLTMASMSLTAVIPRVGDETTLLTRALTNAEVLIENPDEDPARWRMHGRIMERALVAAAASRGIPLTAIEGKEHVLQTLPFSATRKFSAALAVHEGKHCLVILGAPDILLAHADLSDADRTALQEEVTRRAESGERLLGVGNLSVGAAKDFSFSKNLSLDGLSFEGLIAFRDPVRPRVADAMFRVREAGVRTVIVTGDHRGTAVAVAREIGLPVSDGSVMDATELGTLSDEALAARLPHLSVIARVTPVDKLRIARAFQAAGEIVAMTGDGVNDAPSIKEANVGIAMGSGTEVAQSVADLVLLDDNFETIVAAVEEGRQILGNIRKVLVYLLSNVTDGLILVGGALLMGMPLPLNALQILWVNFFADSFPAVAFAFERERQVLARSPRRGRPKLFDPLMKFLILVIGVATSALLYVMYVVLMGTGYDETLVRTFMFAAFGTYTLLAAFALRSLERSIFSYNPFSNRVLTGGVAIGLVLMAIAVYAPPFQTLFGTVALPGVWLAGVVAVGVANVFLMELAKWGFRQVRS